MLRITNVNVVFDDETPLREIAAKRLNVSPEEVLEIKVARRAVDARRYKGAPIYFVYALDVKTTLTRKAEKAKCRRDKQISAIEETARESVVYGDCGLAHRPVVVGMGPAGLFAALVLAKHGYCPLVLERGRDIERRARDVDRFWREGALDEASNVQFGEGGAGAFSDGKLTTRVNDEKTNEILDMLVDAGAPPEIRYRHKPHIGTDRLRSVVKHLREEMISLGAQVRFSAKATDIDIRDGKLTGLVVNGEERIPASVALFAIGHSARDTYALFHEKRVAMEAKAFAIGVRIEHPQAWIDRAQFGEDAGSPLLGAADYALTFQDKASGRGAYSFCMCPGGLVVASSSERDQVVTNGMSNYRRDSGLANSALLVTVGPKDFGGGVLDGIAFQRRYETLAFSAAGGDYRAPAQTVGDFLADRSGSREFLTKPSYLPGIRTTKLSECLPPYVVSVLKNALPEFGRKIRGFDDPAAVMTGVETRSSAPCRILRNREFESVSAEGLYPIGEGAGYAGGIMSAALDGYRAALAVMKKYKA